MNKSIVCFLSEKGWSQSEIARRFNVSRNLIWRILTAIKKMKVVGDVLCEVCRKPMEEEGRYIEVEKTKPFLTCKECGEELLTLSP